MPIELDEELLAKRPARLRRILRSLSGNRLVACDGSASTEEKVFVIAAHDGTPAASYRDWYFRTHARDVEAQYFELWKPLNDLTWTMDRAYLQVFLVNRAKRTHDE